LERAAPVQRGKALFFRKGCTLSPSLYIVKFSDYNSSQARSSTLSEVQAHAIPLFIMTGFS
jgi:hypothetical protein